MTHPSHREHKEAFNAKRIQEPVDDAQASRIADLLAAAQRQDHDRPVYRELVKPSNDMQTRRQA